uniref:RAD9 checkpoint clamp component A n=1 Tax=Anser brachyrhynchus TaxID=132585 RepID=A0A8B9D172_9AVES
GGGGVLAATAPPSPPRSRSPGPRRARAVAHRGRAVPGAHRQRGTGLRTGTGPYRGWGGAGGAPSPPPRPPRPGAGPPADGPVPPPCPPPAVPAGRQRLALRLRLLPPGAPLLPAVPARAPRRAPALQGAHEVLPRRLPLAARAGEDGGAVPGAAAAPCQPPGGAAALQVRVLAEAVVHFPQTLAEVTLGAGPGGRISLRSYVEDEADLGKAMVTELWLAPDEFQAVAVVPDSRITFCLKEFRGILTFAEASNLPLTIHYDAPGRPAIFTLEDPLMEAHLVLATLLDPESSSQPPAANGISHAPAPSDDFADDLESYMVAMETGSYGEDSGAPPSPTFPLRTPRPIESDPQEEEEEEEEEGAVPGTPPHKKFRSLFFGSVMTAGGPSPAPSQEVLAEDSDGEC